MSNYTEARDRRGKAKSALERSGYATGGIAFPETQFRTSMPATSPFSRAREMDAATAADSAAVQDGSKTALTKR